MSKKRKATYTKATAKENRDVLKQAKLLLKDSDLNSVPKDHPATHAQLKAEFPAVSDARLWSRMAQAYRQLRYEKYFVIE